MTNTTSWKVAGIHALRQQLCDSGAPSDGKGPWPVAAPPKGNSDRLITTVDHAIDTSSEPSPEGLVQIVLSNLGPADRASALHEALRAYIELRIYERQGEPQLVRTEDNKVRENRLRRMASRQGLTITKSRRRDPRALDYGTYGLVRVEEPGGDQRSGVLVAGDPNTGFGLSLDDIERELTSGA